MSPRAKEGMKRLTDYVPDQSIDMEGEQVKSEDILGDEIELLDFAFLPSKEHEGDFAVMQFKLKDKLCTTAIGAKAVVEKLKQMPKQYLPVLLTVVSKKSKSTGRMYYAVE